MLLSHVVPAVWRAVNDGYVWCSLHAAAAAAAEFFMQHQKAACSCAHLLMIVPI